MSLKYAMFELDFDPPYNRVAINPEHVVSLHPLDKNFTVIHTTSPINNGHLAYTVKGDYDQVVADLTNVWKGVGQGQQRKPLPRIS
ncbi:hypothetical protein IB265_34755 [Ensifer sp. ENS10]|uniref:hypothetical protein n=1 Tax=Ensifer sp. ENS10 TaxID=2769286 RepID=UPI00177E5B34|nr:hypothetical protein [Ensifer sp. ENS10]MBD9511912.1 hypothetical protein [Ensifer sp. ENS10]